MNRSGPSSPLYLGRPLIDGIELKHLRAALLAAELHSFSKAAAKLSIKQTTLSQHISYLERRFGTALFRRSPRGVVPTEAGEVFLKSAHRVFAELNGLYTKTRSAGQGSLGSLSIGFIASITAGNLRSSLFAFQEQYPHITMRGVEEAPHALFAKLETGALDILVIGGTAAHPGMQRLTLWSEPIYIALPANHPLASRDQIYWPDLRDETILAARNTASDIEALVSTRLPRTDYSSSLIVTELSREVVLSMISAGYGMTIISAASIGLRMDNIVYRELNEGTAPHVLNFSAYWRADNSNPPLEIFLSFLRKRYSLVPIGE